MADRVAFDIEKMYESWRDHLLENSLAKYFGMVYDPTKVAKFPYANFMVIGFPSNGGDLEGDEATVNLTIETEAYINTNKYMTLYNIDGASTDFFIDLGFRKIGNSTPLKVSDTVTKIQSRFILMNFDGNFLKELE